MYHHAWHPVTTDYTVGLPHTPQGNNAIAVSVDKMTEHAYVYAVPYIDTSHAIDWANMCVEHVVKHERLSAVIIL